ncbi:ABC transporter ATP-binding protein [Saccharopolyspora phatthalungensis]|uniref:Peptide/nickel transport system ATP-binding protein n=1 Tax=Saccharopolyspora phatthalungensis TaxID=664693 RepID=A0A840QK22_9PSEU|nr:ABC transporter ATP-binding protein [Saccharopolyspora phatthalungensis]MBB5159858.1 peptide/nickel transport system ATP-binding protein [Saccharopolyspora phatthalungensis]
MTKDSTNRPVLEVRGLDVAYEVAGATTPVLRDVGISLHAGELLAVVGESGSGKSTLAHAAIGLLPPTGKITGGSIRLDGQETTTLGRASSRRLLGSKIGLVPQDPMMALNPVKRIGVQVAEALRVHHRTPKSEWLPRVVALLGAVGLNDAGRVAMQYPHELSGGMRQRALIAAALISEPSLLVADEPTSALDVTVQARILDLIGEAVRQRDVATLLITHDIGVALERADRIAVVHHGEVVALGTPAEIAAAPPGSYTARLLGSAPSMTSTRLAQPTTGTAEAPLVRVDRVSKTFRGRGRHGPVHALTDASLTIGHAETVALVGESGSGKSTLGRIVQGMEQPTTGSVEVAGIEASRLTGRALRGFRPRVQMVYQSPYASLDPHHDIADLVKEPLDVQRRGTRSERARTVAAMIDRVGLPTSVLRKRPAELSGGQRQRVAIARALVLQPQLVICDEPVSALDATVQAQILELLAQLQRYLGVSYLFISHDLAVVRQIAHRTYVMHAGCIVDSGETTALVDQPGHAYTRELLAAVPRSDSFLTRP